VGTRVRQRPAQNPPTRARQDPAVEKAGHLRQEIYGYLLTHYALSALICRAATETDIDPDRIKFTRTVRIIRRRVTDPAAFSP